MISCKLTLICAAVLLVFGTNPSSALIESHKIHGTETWKFVTKFCFNPDSHTATGSGKYKGVFKYKIAFPMNTSLAWYVYFHDKDSWDKAYMLPGDCFDKGNVAYARGNVFRLPNHPNLTVVKDYQDDLFPAGIANVVSGELVFYSERPRWFYFALGNCDSRLNKDGLMDRKGQFSIDSVKAIVDVEMLNGNGPEMHYSADELGKLASYTTFLILYLLVLLCPVMYTVITLKKRKMFHHTVKILVLSMVLELISIVFGLMYQSLYASRGYKYAAMEATAFLFHAGADCFMVILLLVIAKGWTIVRRKISAKGRVKIGMFCTLYAATYYAVLIWHFQVGKDPAAVTYLYDSPPGSVLQWLRFVAIFWFMYSCHTTRVNYVTKKGFYFGFFIVGTLWFAALPLQVVIANNVMQLWYRSGFVTNVELTLNLTFYVGFVMFFWPSTFNRNFPFHAKTTDMEEPLRKNSPADKRKRRSTHRGQSSSLGSGNTNNNRFGNHNTTEIRGATSTGFSTPGGFNLVNNNQSSNSTLNSRRSVSGGFQVGAPEARIETALRTMRSKIAALHDVSDDIEYALSEITEPYDEDDEDLEMEEEKEKRKSQKSESNEEEGVEMAKKKREGKGRKKPRPPPSS